MMKYLVIVLVIVLVLWLARTGGRARKQKDAQAKAEATPAKPVAPHQMVSCARCGVHLPIDEALPGPGGHYCCDAHRSPRN
jgi:uncharacterized protein